jgi:hypothetical protein
MVTWRRGRELVSARRAEIEGPLLDFVASHVPLADLPGERTVIPGARVPV